MGELNLNYYRFEFPGQIDEIALARLYEVGFEAFEEKEQVMEGYLLESLWTEKMEERIKAISPFKSYTLIKPQNWNAVWESSFTPITIDDKIHIRATFHPASQFPYEIIIDPKMAFGTGHHATTYLVLAEMLKLDLKNARVLDFGCGSGILAIAAEKLGAQHITAIDYDIWSVENTIENKALNNCQSIRTYQADNLISESEKFDYILANITRDILIQNTPDIIHLLKPGGKAIYSGFIRTDLEQMKEHLKTFGINQLSFNQKEDWCVLTFLKN
jgi:ribosomal protein L11 methyltransferase